MAAYRKSTSLPIYERTAGTGRRLGLLSRDAKQTGLGCLVQPLRHSGDTRTVLLKIKFFSSVYRARATRTTAAFMFTGIIERWVALAPLSDNWEIRQGHHTRESDWPEELVRAEYDRHRFDTQLCWAGASHVDDSHDRALAFAMATHPRLGALSPALCLVSDVVRQVAGSLWPMPLELFCTEYLHARTVPRILMSTHPVHRMAFSGVPISGPVADTATAVVLRRLLKSEEEHMLSHAWPGRAPLFFCRRGWFAGVPVHGAPHDTTRDGVQVKGIFESVPHIFCDVWFPICRPFSVCMHLVHVSYIAGSNVAT